MKDFIKKQEKEIADELAAAEFLRGKEDLRIEGYVTEGNHTDLKGHIRFCFLMIWDDLVHFVMEHHKLDRLLGIPLTFLMKFKSIGWVFSTLATFIVVVIILGTEAAKYNTPKHKHVSLIE